MSVRNRTVRPIPPEALERRRTLSANYCSAPTCKREPLFVARWEQDVKGRKEPVGQLRALCDEHARRYAAKHDLLIAADPTDQEGM